MAVLPIFFAKQRLSITAGIKFRRRGKERSIQGAVQSQDSQTIIIWRPNRQHLPDGKKPVEEEQELLGAGPFVEYDDPVVRLDVGPLVNPDLVTGKAGPGAGVGVVMLRQNPTLSKHRVAFDEDSLPRCVDGTHRRDPLGQGSACRVAFDDLHLEVVSRIPCRNFEVVGVDGSFPNLRRNRHDVERHRPGATRVQRETVVRIGIACVVVTLIRRDGQGRIARLIVAAVRPPACGGVWRQIGRIDQSQAKRHAVPSLTIHRYDSVGVLVLRRIGISFHLVGQDNLLRKMVVGRKSKIRFQREGAVAQTEEATPSVSWRPSRAQISSVEGLDRGAFVTGDVKQPRSRTDVPVNVEGMNAHSDTFVEPGRCRTGQLVGVSVVLVDHQHLVGRRHVNAARVAKS